MSRTKGSKNKKSVSEPLNTLMNNAERLEFLAQLISEKIEQDQSADELLLRKIGDRETVSN